MDMAYFLKVVVPVLVTIVIGIVIERVLAAVTTNLGKKRGLAPSHIHLIKLTVRWLVIIVLVIVVAGIFGVGLQSIWVSIAAFLAMMVVGFFAVWSVLSNVLAALILLIWRPCRIGDKVTILPENLSGKIIDLNLLFVIMESEEGDKITVPNNMVMQRFLKVSGNK